MQQDNQTKFYFLIMFDQITRNISRVLKENEFKNDQKALKIAEYLCSINYDLTIPFLQRIFILLPFRHTNKLNNLNFVIARLNEYHPNLKDIEKNDYTKFYIASLKNYTTCTDNISVLSQSPRILNYDSEKSMMIIVEHILNW